MTLGNRFCMLWTANATVRRDLGTSAPITSNVAGTESGSQFVSMSAPAIKAQGWRDANMTANPQIMGSVDTAKMDTFIAGIAKELDVVPVNAALTIEPKVQSVAELLANPDIDLVLMDIMLKGPMDGITAAEIFHNPPAGGT